MNGVWRVNMTKRQVPKSQVFPCTPCNWGRVPFACKQKHLILVNCMSKWGRKEKQGCFIVAVGVLVADVIPTLAGKQHWKSSLAHLVSDQLGNVQELPLRENASPRETILLNSGSQPSPEIPLAGIDFQLSKDLCPTDICGTAVFGTKAKLLTLFCIFSPILCFKYSILNFT